MNGVIFETFIDGQKYAFHIHGGPTIFRVDSYKNGIPFKRAWGETEEKAILQLVKIIEK